MIIRAHIIGKTLILFRHPLLMINRAYLIYLSLLITGLRYYRLYWAYWSTTHYPVRISIQNLVLIIRFTILYKSQLRIMRINKFSSFRPTASYYAPPYFLVSIYPCEIELSHGKVYHQIQMFVSNIFNFLLEPPIYIIYPLCSIKLQKHGLSRFRSIFMLP